MPPRTILPCSNAGEAPSIWTGSVKSAGAVDISICVCSPCSAGSGVRQLGENPVAGAGLAVTGGAVAGIELPGQFRQPMGGVLLPDQRHQIPDLLVVQLRVSGFLAQILPGLRRAVCPVIVLRSDILPASGYPAAAPRACRRTPSGRQPAAGCGASISSPSVTNSGCSGAAG